MRIVLQKAPDGVIRAICNAALNAREGDVLIPFHLKHIFAKYHRHIHRLTDRRCPLVDDAALSGAQPDLNTVQKQDIKDGNSHTLTPALKMVRELRVGPQYELKARNLILRFSITQMCLNATIKANWL